MKSSLDLKYEDAFKSIKILGPVIALTVVLLGLASWQLYTAVDVYFKNKTLSQEIINDDFQKKHAAVAQRLSTIASALYLIANSPVFRQFTPADASFHERLTRILLAFGRVAPDAYQIRFIDTTGQEKIRIKNTNGSSQAVVPHLQNKAQRDYFQDLHSTPAGQMYVSPIDLNIENGQIQTPWVPTLRLATPVATATGIIIGYVVANIGVDWVFDVYEQSQTQHLTQSYILGPNGSWFSGQEPELLFGGARNISASFAVQMPNAWENINSKESGFFEKNNDSWYFAKVTLADFFPNALDLESPKSNVLFALTKIPKLQ